MFHVWPPSVEISTEAMPPSAKARPQISTGPLPTFAFGAGLTINNSGATCQTGRVPPLGLSGEGATVSL